VRADEERWRSRADRIEKFKLERAHQNHWNKMLSIKQSLDSGEL
jgi:hypothetical protein